MPNIKDKIAERANLWSQMTEIMDRAADEGRDLSAEETATYDRLETDLDKVDNAIERQRKHDSRSSSYDAVDRSGVIPSGPAEDETRNEDFERAFSRFLKVGVQDLDPDDRAIMRAQFQADDAIKNAAGVGTGAGGGYAVPTAFRDTFVETMKWYGPMLQEAEVIETQTGANLPWATNDDTGNVGAILAENTQVTEQDVTIGTASLDAYMYTSKLVRVSFQLINDKPDFDTWLARKLGERIGRILNQHFTTGTGTSQPDGIVTSATVGVTGSGSLASTGGVNFDNIIDLTEAIDPAYGNAGGQKFMGHQTARKALRKVKDSQNRYIWEPSTQVGAPNLVYGYEFILNNDMPTVAQNSKSLLFGNIRSAYVARIVQGLTTLRLAERYADYLQVGFLAFERADGTMQDANAVRVFQTTPTA